MFAEKIFTGEWTRAAFPPERTDEFFAALFGGAEEGAYDIELTFTGGQPDLLEFAFNLHRRGNACLACNMTYGLPGVFERHPVIKAAALAAHAASSAGRVLDRWEIGATEERSKALHVIPFYVWLR